MPMGEDTSSNLDTVTEIPTKEEEIHNVDTEVQQAEGWRCLLGWSGCREPFWWKCTFWLKSRGLVIHLLHSDEGKMVSFPTKSLVADASITMKWKRRGQLKTRIRLTRPVVDYSAGQRFIMMKTAKEIFQQTSYQKDLLRCLAMYPKHCRVGWVPCRPTVSSTSNILYLPPGSECHGSNTDDHCNKTLKCGALKMSTLKYCSCHISSWEHQIFKILVSTPHN